MNEQKKLAYGIVLDTDKLEQQSRYASKQFQNISDAAESSGNQIASSFKKIGAAVGIAFSTQQITQFIGSVVKMRGEIESLEISFATLLGDKGKADAMFGAIREFAANTPMMLKDLASGAQTMLGFGIAAEQVLPMLKAIGDISMGDSQKFQSLSLAFSQMSATGKLMGQDLLQMINAGFNPLATISEKTGKSISELKDEMSNGAISAEMVTQAFIDATSEGGKFFQMLEKQSKGVNGAISNLQGAWDDMLNAIGEKAQGAITGTVLKLTDLVKNYEKVGRIITEIIATYGVYKATLITLNTIEKLRYQATLAQMAGMTKMQALTDILKAKTEALNKALLKNPYVLIAAGVAALAIGIYKVATATTTAEKALKKLGETEKQTNKEIAAERAEVDILFARLKAAKEGTEEYDNAKQAIISKYGNYLQKLGDEKTALNDIALAYKTITEEATKASQARALEAATTQAANDYGAAIADAREEVYKQLKKKFGNQTDADGVNLAETYFWKIVPVLEGTEEMSDEVREIIKQFDVLNTYTVGTTAQTYSYTTNALQSSINGALSAKKVLDDTINEARRRFSQVPLKPDDINNDDDNEPKAAPVKNKKYWEEQKKNAEAELEALSDIEAKGAKGAALKKKIAEYQKKIDLFGVAKDSDDDASKFEEQVSELWLKVSEAEVAAMKDGTAKRLIEIENQRDKTLFAIDKEQDALEKEAKKLGKKLTPEQLGTFERRREETRSAADNQIAEVEKERAEYIASLYDKLTDVFLSDEQKKVGAIRKTYEEQRKQLEKDLSGGTVSQSQYQSLLELINKAEQKEINEYWISLYGTYSDKIKMMQQEWETTAQYIPQEFRAEAERQYRAAIAALESAQLKDSNIYQKFFSATLTLGKEKVIELSNTLKNDLNAQFKAGAISIDEYTEALQQIDDKVNEVIRDTSELGTYLSGGGLEAVFNKRFNEGGDQQTAGMLEFKAAQELYNKAIKEGDIAAQGLAKSNMRAAEATQEAGAAAQAAAAEALRAIDAIDAIVNGINDTVQGLNDSVNLIAGVADSFGVDTSEGTGWGQAMQFFDSFAESSRYASDAWNSLKSGDIGGVIRGVTGSVASIITGINKMIDADHSKKIRDLQEQIDDLADAYDDLNYAANKAIGSNKQAEYEEMTSNLERQNQLIKQQIAEEEAKKNTDENVVNELQNKLKENERLIEENKAAALDAIIGSDITSAIDGLESALTDAWAEGKKGAQSAKEYAKTMLKQMVSESIKAYIQAQGYMDRIRSALADAMADDIITEQEKERIYKMSEDIANEIEEKYGWANEIYSDKQREGLKGSGIAASQDSVDNLDARMTTVQGHTYTLVQGQAEIIRATNAILEKVAGIEENTSRSEERLSEINNTMNRVRNTIDDISLKGVKLRS